MMILTMSYKNKLLTMLSFTAVSAVTLNAAALVEFTFNNAGGDIDERAGWDSLGTAVQDPRVFLRPNEDLFNNAIGMTIAPEFIVPVPAGMQPIVANNAYAGQVNPLTPNPTDTLSALTQFTAFAQFTIENDKANDPPLAPVGWAIVPESVTLQATATNLNSVVLLDNQGIINTIASPAANGSVNITIPIINRDRIDFGGPISYTLYLVGNNAGGPKTSLSFDFANNDFYTYNGTIEAIPEPSVYMAGATALMLGGFLYIRRRKAANKQEDKA